MVAPYWFWFDYAETAGGLVPYAGSESVASRGWGLFLRFERLCIGATVEWANKRAKE